LDPPLRRALTALANRQSLSEDQTAEVFGVVMGGEATPGQIGGLLMGLRAKGETADELAGAARALRRAMVRVTAAHDHLVDTCGTGGGTRRRRRGGSRPETRQPLLHFTLRVSGRARSARRPHRAGRAVRDSRVE